MDGEKKVNLIIKIVNALSTLMSKMKIKCHSKCCESDCMLNEEEKKEIIKRKSISPKSSIIKSSLV
jgi:hypothetical protein